MRLSARFLVLYLVAWTCHSGMLFSQVNATVDFTQRIEDHVTSIDLSWSEADEKAWHFENDGRLDIPALKTNIQSYSLRKSDGETSSFRFSLESPASIELMIHIEQIVPGESIYLKDIATGRKVFDFSRISGRSFLTPVFDPAVTVLEWTCESSKAYQSVFSIPNIYFQPIIQSRSLDIGFGTSFPCHPNAACKEDSMMQLISKSAVRIRLVMQEGIGWCSGSFINNARQDKTPYLLTAFHCQFEYTPFYDMWRFDFNYASTNCPTPADEPAIFSITGCELISLGQASDFLLVRLGEEIPVNLDVTFAGWDRDEMLKPDTSYLVHHPNADIRKFSTSINQATIHPNQIGWSEGYTTPANHHFRFKFTEGGHEPGSSGGPLFNEDGYLVGQLHGGTAGCELSNNTFIGRLSKSWNLGVTSQERLSDWLDPDQTNLTQISSLPNLGANDVIDITGILTDPVGRPLKNVLIKVTGAKEVNLVTGDDGSFMLSQVSRSGQYTLTPEKNGNPTNGLSALDLLAIQKHLLGKDTFSLPWKFIAADATNNGNLSVGDIVLLMKLMLGKIQFLPFSPSWRFDPPQLMIDPITQDAPYEAHFMGIKIGDLNATADPGQ